MKREYTAHVSLDAKGHVAWCLEAALEGRGETEEEALADLRASLELCLKEPGAVETPRSDIHTIQVSIADPEAAARAGLANSAPLREFRALVVPDGGWRVALCLEVEIASQGETVAEALAMLTEAMELYFEPPAPAEILAPEIHRIEVAGAAHASPALP